MKEGLSKEEGYKNVNHIKQLLNFTTEGRICLIVMQLFKKNLNDIPKMSSQPDDVQQ